MGPLDAAPFFFARVEVKALLFALFAAFLALFAVKSSLSPDFPFWHSSQHRTPPCARRHIPASAAMLKLDLFPHPLPSPIPFQVGLMPRSALRLASLCWSTFF